MTDLEKIAANLDIIKPRWFIEWADQRDLQDAMGDEKLLRDRVSKRLFHSIIVATVAAGLADFRRPE